MARYNSTPLYWQSAIVIIGLLIAFIDLTSGIFITVIGVIFWVLGYLKKSKELKRAIQNIKQRKNFTFTITAAEALYNECGKNEELSWWRPESKDRLVFYKRGYYDGEGKVGELPHVLLGAVNNLIDREDEIAFYINGTEVEAKVSKWEVRHGKKSKELANLFEKKYNPRSDIELRVQHNLGERIRAGKEATLDIKGKEYYINNPEEISIDFTLEDGRMLTKDNEDQKLLRIIRAYHSGYDIRAKVLASQLTNADLLVTFNKSVKT